MTKLAVEQFNHELTQTKAILQKFWPVEPYVTHEIVAKAVAYDALARLTREQSQEIFDEIYQCAQTARSLHATLVKWNIGMANATRKYLPEEKAKLDEISHRRILARRRQNAEIAYLELLIQKSDSEIDKHKRLVEQYDFEMKCVSLAYHIVSS